MDFQAVAEEEYTSSEEDNSETDEVNSLIDHSFEPDENSTTYLDLTTLHETKKMS